MENCYKYILKKTTHTVPDLTYLLYRYCKFSGKIPQTQYLIFPLTFVHIKMFNTVIKYEKN